VSEENGGGAPSYGELGYVVMVWSPTGYTLAERGGEPPNVGDEFEDNGRTLVVSKVGASPLPGDTRPCAFSVGKS
jgi:hypothetical protein